MINGFYGGKFMPMHKGHLYCIDKASRQCDRVVVIMFINGPEEMDIRQSDRRAMLEAEARAAQARRVCGLYGNVEFHIIDTLPLRKSNGEEDWDAETPLVRQYVPRMDFVYSSEPSYGAYFARAYPEARHIIVDAQRKHVPISGTMIRAMELLEERALWMV